MRGRIQTLRQLVGKEKLNGSFDGRTDFWLSSSRNGDRRGTPCKLRLKLSPLFLRYYP
jgi:hypothetical protein